MSKNDLNKHQYIQKNAKYKLVIQMHMLMKYICGQEEHSLKSSKKIENSSTS